MIIYVPILILIAAGLIACASVLSFQQKQVNKRFVFLQKALWTRRNKLPLLIEVLSRSGVRGASTDEMIQIRSKLMTPLSLSDAFTEEKRLTTLLNDLFNTREEDPKLKGEPLYHVLKKEFATDLESIRITLNDYNFALQRFKSFARQPWFKIFEFLFEARRFAPLPPL